MPQGAPLTHFLRGLNKDELQAIPERCDWCAVRKTDVPIDDLSKRIRRSIKRNVRRGNITYAGAMHDIRDEVIIPTPDTTSGRIRHHLRSTPAATHIGDVRIEEEWFSAQLYGALWADLQQSRPYTIHLEKELNTRNRPSADIYVQSERDDGDYLIEVKRTPISDSVAKVVRQINRYHRAIEEDLGRTREGTFLCIIGEEEDPTRAGGARASESLGDYLKGVGDKIEQEVGDITHTEVVTNTF